MPRKHSVGDHVVGHRAMVYVSCVSREQRCYDDLCGNNGFSRGWPRESLTAMFPRLISVDIIDPDAFGTAPRAVLDVDAPSVVSVERRADEIPSFAPLLAQMAVKTVAMQQIPNRKENRTDVAARA